jgi:hypothetical protein
VHMFGRYHCLVLPSSPRILLQFLVFWSTWQWIKGWQLKVKKH